MISNTPNVANWVLDWDAELEFVEVADWDVLLSELAMLAG